MTKAELVGKIARDARITKRAAEQSLKSVVAGVRDSLKQGRKVTLPGLGTFARAERAARSGRNLQTGGVMKIEAAKVPRFRAGKALKECLDVSWNTYHLRSELLAIEAELASRAGHHQHAEDLFREAAQPEEDAFNELPTDKHRTRGVTAVSAVALWYKGRNYDRASCLARSYLQTEKLPAFAEAQLRELLQKISAAAGQEIVGTSF